jgi:hypothetical protein
MVRDADSVRSPDRSESLRGGPTARPATTETCSVNATGMPDAPFRPPTLRGKQGPSQMPIGGSTTGRGERPIRRPQLAATAVGEPTDQPNAILSTGASRLIAQSPLTGTENYPALGLRSHDAQGAEDARQSRNRSSARKRCAGSTRDARSRRMPARDAVVVRLDRRRVLHDQPRRPSPRTAADARPPRRRLRRPRGFRAHRWAATESTGPRGRLSRAAVRSRGDVDDANHREVRAWPGGGAEDRDARCRPTGSDPLAS